MKLLIVGDESAQDPLVEGLIASPLWEVRHCRDVTEAEAMAGLEAFDYILAESAYEARLEAAVAGSGMQRGEAARVIRMSEAVGADLKASEGEAVYGCYPVTPCRSSVGVESWVFEYHAPCRIARRA